MNDYLDIKNS